MTVAPPRRARSPMPLRALIASLACTVALVAPSQAVSSELGSSRQSGEDAQLGYDINAASGNLFLSQPDIHVHAGLGPDLDFVRYYNSQSQGQDLGIGPNWTHSYSWSVQANGNTASITTDVGKILTFTYLPSAARWAPPTGEFGSLAGQLSTGLSYTTKYGTTYSFDSSGRLVSIAPADSTGTISIAYSGGNEISTVTSGAGPGAVALTFTYSAGHIAHIVDPAGTQWDYAYMPLNGLFSSADPMLVQGGSGPLQVVSVSTHPQSTNPLSALRLSRVLRMTLYGYVSQSVAGTTFVPGSGAVAQLTGYARVTSLQPSDPTHPVLRRNISEVLSGLFSYSMVSGISSVTQAASGVVGGKLLRDVTLSYATSTTAGTLVTTAQLNGGQKIITSTQPAKGYFRIASINSSAGAGVDGDIQSSAFTWNENLTLRTATDALGTMTQFGNYDVRGNPRAIVEAAGTPSERATTLTYHPVLSRPLSISRASVDGVPNHVHTVIWDYDCDYNDNYNTDPKLSNYVHQIVESGYSAAGVTGVVDSPETHVLQIKYAGSGSMPTGLCGGVSQPLGADKIVSVVGPQGPSSLPPPPASYVIPQTRFDYTPSGYLAHITRVVGNGAILTNAFNGYDADGRVTQAVDPSGTVTNIGYDSFGAPIGEEKISSDGNQRTSSSYAYDLANNPILYLSPEGSGVRIDRDAASRPWRMSGVRADGAVIWSEVTDFDLYGRPSVVRRFAGQGTDEGPSCTPTGAEQACTELTYDLWERIRTVHTLDPQDKICGGAGIVLNCTQYYAFDGDGHLTASGNQSNGYSLNTYDRLGRLISVVDPRGSLTTAQYDINDHVIMTRDALDPANRGSGASGRNVTYTVDDFGRTVALTSPDIGRWLNYFDLAGHLVSSMDSVGASLNYTYDGIGRRTSVSSLTNETTNFLYDETGSIGATGGTFSNTLGRLSSVQSLDANGGKVWDHYAYDYRGWVTAEVQERASVLGPFVSTFQYGWGDNHEPTSVTFPTGVVVSYKYPKPALYAPEPRANEVDATYGTTTSVLVSGATYFADGQLQSLTYGSGSSLSMSRNKRGEITQLSAQSTSASPILEQTYTLDPNVIGQVNAVDFFPGKSNAWHWTMSYDQIGELIGYTTDVRKGPNLPSGDVYTWEYDAVGNRTSETYNGAKRQFCFDAGCDSKYVTNQLQRASGIHVLDAANLTAPGSILGFMSLGYDGNGSVLSDTVAYSVNTSTSITYGFQYDSRHRLSRINQITNGELLYQQNSYDGLNRISEVFCPNTPGTIGWGGFCRGTSGQNNNSTCSAQASSTSGDSPPTSGATCNSSQYAKPVCWQGHGWMCVDNVWTPGYDNYCAAVPNALPVQRPTGRAASNSSFLGAATWKFFFYNRRGLLQEESQYDNTGAYGYPVFNYTDHVYLGGTEIARVTSQYQDKFPANSVADSCSMGTPNIIDPYIFQVADLQYLYHDYRNALVAVESQNKPKLDPPQGLPHLIWEAEVSPFGKAVTIGLRGPNGKIGDVDTVADDPVSTGPAAATPAGDLASFLLLPSATDNIGGSRELDPSAGRALSPSLGALAGGGSPYLPLPSGSSSAWSSGARAGDSGTPVPAYNPNGGFDYNYKFNANDISNDAKLESLVGTAVGSAGTLLRIAFPESNVPVGIAWMGASVGLWGASRSIYQGSQLNVAVHAWSPSGDWGASPLGPSMRPNQNPTGGGNQGGYGYSPGDQLGAGGNAQRSEPDIDFTPGPNLNQFQQPSTQQLYSPGWIPEAPSTSGGPQKLEAFVEETWNVNRDGTVTVVESQCNGACPQPQ